MLVLVVQGTLIVWHDTEVEHGFTRLEYRAIILSNDLGSMSATQVSTQPLRPNYIKPTDGSPIASCQGYRLERTQRNYLSLWKQFVRLLSCF